ncbi:hypothetical protein KEM56_006482 [Ascosphaera pollenicola]|nr:hypothetical protein KEM56_006482 [Ascosphaera pollenicola]
MLGHKHAAVAARTSSILNLSSLGPWKCRYVQAPGVSCSLNDHGLSLLRRFNTQSEGTPIVSASDDDLARLFGGQNVTTAERYAILCELQQRRIDGTLDLNPTAEMKKVTNEQTLNDALEWLRSHHPMDEDAAILRRIEREEKEAEEQLIQRAERLGLYKPQGGEYQEHLSDDGDVRGQSVLEEVRKRNEAKAKIEQEEERRRWLEGELEEQKALERQQLQLRNQTLQLQKSEEAQSALTEARPRADPDERPALAWIQKHHVRATNADIDTTKLTKMGRILPSFCVTLLTVGLCYVFSQNYELFEHEDRLWPNTPKSAATVIGLIGVNVAIFALWRAFPPAWRMLNRYFISVPLYPYSASMVGSMFSHQLFRHLAMNMIILWVMGTKLHQEVGRGEFLSLYVASGAIASFTSLTALVLQNKLHVTSLGASGAIAGVLAAWCIRHSQDELTLAFIPKSWEQYLHASGSTFLSALVLIELVSLVSPLRLSFIGAMDHWAHLGGYAAGAAAASVWKDNSSKQIAKKR